MTLASTIFLHIATNCRSPLAVARRKRKLTLIFIQWIWWTLHPRVFHTWQRYSSGWSIRELEVNFIRKIPHVRALCGNTSSQLYNDAYVFRQSIWLFYSIICADVETGNKQLKTRKPGLARNIQIFGKSHERFNYSHITTWCSANREFLKYALKPHIRWWKRIRRTFRVIRNVVQIDLILIVTLFSHIEVHLIQSRLRV